MKQTSSNLRSFLGHLCFQRVSLVGAAVLLVAVLGMLHLLGWRDDTAILSGTSTSSNPNATAIRGVLYATFYFSAVVVNPILILAAALNALLRRLTK